MHYGHFVGKPKHVGVVSELYVTIGPTSVLQKWAGPNVTKHFTSSPFVARLLPRVTHLVTINIFGRIGLFIWLTGLENLDRFVF
jgi:hypothetical protein